MDSDAEPAAGASRRLLLNHGLMAGEGRGVQGTLRYERPAYIYGHRLKNCKVGAFTYFNAAGLTSCYRVHFGRYSQIGESSVIGPPEHPSDWFSSHPFAFTRPRYMPNIYEFEEFARLAPDDQPGASYVDTAPSDTVIGHEAYVGACSFVKRGVTIGDGALVGAHSVVTRDIPAYAVAVGSPARVIRMRFSDTLVERFLKLQWWRYDLAPFKAEVDFREVEATLDFFEQQLADGLLLPLTPPSFQLSQSPDGLHVETLAAPLYFC